MCPGKAGCFYADFDMIRLVFAVDHSSSSVMTDSIGC